MKRERLSGITQARNECDGAAGTDPIATQTSEKGEARGPGRLEAKDRDDTADKRGRQKMARLVRMHGGLIIEGGR